MLKKLFSGKAEFVYLTVILILLALIAVYNWVIAALACILIAGVSVLTHKSDTERNREITRYFDAISQSVDQATTYAHRHCDCRQRFSFVLGKQCPSRLGRGFRSGK